MLNQKTDRMIEPLAPYRSATASAAGSEIEATLPEPVAEISAETDSETESLGKRLSLKDRLLDIKTLVGFGFSALIIAFFFLTVKIDVGSIWSNIVKVDLLWLLAAFAMFYVGIVIRGARWQMLLHNAGFEQERNIKFPGLVGLTEIVFLSVFVNSLVPAKLGDAYRGYLLKKNAGASFSRTLGTVFAERVADMLVLFSLLCVGGLVAFSSVESKMSGVSLVFVFGLILVLLIIAGLLALRFFPHYIEKLIPERFHSFFRRFQQGTVRSFRRDTQLKLYGFTILIWVCEGIRLYFVLQGLNVQLDLSVVLFIALTSALLTALPFTPSGLGAVEGTTLFVLTTFAVEKNLAGSVALLDRVITYWSVILVGAILYLFTKKK